MITDERDEWNSSVALNVERLGHTCAGKRREHEEDDDCGVVRARGRLHLRGWRGGRGHFQIERGQCGVGFVEPGSDGFRGRCFEFEGALGLEWRADGADCWIDLFLFTVYGCGSEAAATDEL